MSVGTILVLVRNGDGVVAKRRRGHGERRLYGRTTTFSWGSLRAYNNDDNVVQRVAQRAAREWRAACRGWSRALAGPRG